MEEAIVIQLPGEIRQMLNRTPEELARDVRLYAGLMLFRLGKLSSGAAAEMAGVPRVMFLDLCASMTLRCHRSRVTTCAESCLVSKRPIVCDTTVLLYLGRIGQLDLLPALFEPVWVPESIQLELDMGILLRRYR